MAVIRCETTSLEGLQGTVDAILADVQRAWNTHAVQPKIASRFKRWWNTACVEAMNVLRAECTSERRPEFKRGETVRERVVSEGPL